RPASETVRASVTTTEISQYMCLELAPIEREHSLDGLTLAGVERSIGQARRPMLKVGGEATGFTFIQDLPEGERKQAAPDAVFSMHDQASALAPLARERDLWLVTIGFVEFADARRAEHVCQYR